MSTKSENENKALKAEVARLKKLTKQLENQENKENEDLSGYFKPDRRVVLVGLYDFADGLSNYFKISNREFKFKNLGQKFSISFLEFEEVISNHRKLFEQGLITVSDQDNDIAKYFDLPSMKNSTLGIDTFKNLVNLSIEDLEKIYERVCDSQKGLIISKWIRGYWDYDRKLPNSDIAYMDRDKIALLEKLSPRSMKNILDDIDSKRMKGLI